MAGIYLHIPFCKTRCIYCDFYSSTGSAKQERYVRALCRELEERLPYLNGEPVYTIYIGGGTPSQLKEAEFRLIFETLDRVCGLQQAGEITLEANPDD
ncbi:MAG: coproporphyrinogen III oxidase, partial [Mediterranea sp.]|nr:coproporphyrinogen III oxidase [Mediterranea sp.]